MLFSTLFTVRIGARPTALRVVWVVVISDTVGRSNQLGDRGRTPTPLIDDSTLVLAHNLLQAANLTEGHQCAEPPREALAEEVGPVSGPQTPQAAGEGNPPPEDYVVRREQ